MNERRADERQLISTNVFPATGKENGRGKSGRGISSHTDYGLLVMAAQDEVGGLFIRPPLDGEKLANRDTSAAGFKEDDENWVYVPPQPGIFAVFPGQAVWSTPL